MFQDAKVVAADCGKDQDLLIAYLQEDLNGTIPADLYGNPYGEGRIKILTTGAEEAHRYVETERVEATAEQDGYVKYVCSICGEEKTEVMPKLSGEEEKTEVLPEQPGKEGSPSFPETGANIPIVCFALLLGAAAVIGGLGAWKRKSGKSV